jgi:uncharacterized RDD family membrane protein YckC
MEDNYENIIRHAETSELEGVLRQLDRAKYPERYTIVLNEISNRKRSDYVQPESFPVVQPGHKNMYDATSERFWASGIDGIFCFLLTTGLYLILGMGIPKSSSLDGALIRALYSIGITAWFSKTLGKHFMGLLVINHVTRGKISFKQSVLREIGSVASIFILILGICWNKIAPGRIPMFLFLCAAICSIVWAILELITMFSNDERRALHDKIAGTSVVIKRLMN